MTRYEKKILEIIEHSTEHLTAEEIFLRLKQDEPKVVLATIYNNINKLYANNMIRKISTQGMSDRYDNTKRHDHLVCKKCGAISDFTFDDLTKALQDKLGVELVDYDLKAFYICNDCKKL